MIELRDLKDKAIKEYHYFDKRTNIKFDDEDVVDFLNDIIETYSVEEIYEIRFFMAQAYSEVINQIIEETLDSFVLVDIKDYNDQFMEIGEKFDRLFLDRQKILNEKEIMQAKELFDEIFLFYKKIQKNERNLIRKGRKEFVGKILPAWFAVFSAVYVPIILLLFNKLNLEVNLITISSFLAVYILLFLGIVLALKMLIYKKIKK